MLIKVFRTQRDKGYSQKTDQDLLELQDRWMLVAECVHGTLLGRIPDSLETHIGYEALNTAWAQQLNSTVTLYTHYIVAVTHWEETTKLVFKVGWGFHKTARNHSRPQFHKFLPITKWTTQLVRVQKSIIIININYPKNLRLYPVPKRSKPR